MPTAELALSGGVQDVRAARHFVDDVLTAWRAEDYAPAAMQVVSELATNAALHARTRFAVELRLTDEGLRVAVRDFSPRRPSLRSYGPDATTGRGLALVDALSVSWGVSPVAPGKRVWADLGPAGADAWDLPSSAATGLAGFGEEHDRPAAGEEAASNQSGMLTRWRPGDERVAA